MRLIVFMYAVIELKISFVSKFKKFIIKGD